MDLGGIEAIILDHAVGIGGNMSLKAVMNAAVLLGITGRFVPCMATIVALMATGRFDDCCVNTGAFFQDQTALFQDFNGCVKQGGAMSVLAKTPSEDNKGCLVRCLIIHGQPHEPAKGKPVQQHLFKHWIGEIKPLLKHHAFDHHDKGPVTGAAF